QSDLYSVTSGPSPPYTWLSQPTLGSVYATASSAYGGPTCPTAGDVTFSGGGTGGTTLTSLVQAWADGTSPPAIVGIEAHDENASNTGKTFVSSDVGSNGPVLSVTFNHYPDIPTDLSMEDGQAAPVLHGVFSDPDGG